MAGNYDVHLRTLAHVTAPLSVEGSWPGSISMRSGWYRARARPWNESTPDPMLRLERGGLDFLEAVTSHLLGLGADAVYSPALYPDSTLLWRRSGYEDHVTLDIMERPIGDPVSATNAALVDVQSAPDWEEILRLDRLAFEGFWGMSRLGLQEAHQTNRSTAVLVVENGPRLSGYAIVGVQWATAFLHRIAVSPDQSGRGLGAALLAESINWGRRSGGRTMLLNVRPQNLKAKRLYKRMGFMNTGTALEVLRLPRT